MGPCCVDGCEVTSEETYYFEFPTSRILRRKWLELIPITGKLPLGTVVCSRHFHAHDYESVRGKVRLKSKVLPSLLLDKKPKSPVTSRPKSPSPVNDGAPLSPTSPASRKSPLSPATTSKPVEACDSTTVSVPSPVDAEKMIDDIQKITSSVGKLAKVQNGVGEDCGRSSDKSPAPLVPPVNTPPVIPPLDQKEDIEDMITNYHIKNKVPNPALLADLVPPPLEGLLEHVHTVPVEFEVPGSEPIEIEDVKEAEPVFIEVSVDKDGHAAGGGSEDCLMLLESVQVEVDPATLLLAHDDDYYQGSRTHKKEDPISLLTSSDEDDVILQEPHIDTVEVSDETDEDDMPLVKLVKKKPVTKKKLQKKKSKLKKPEEIEKVLWGMYDFYCVQCHFSTKNISEYDKHVSEHSTVLLVCPICSYTSASKSMFARHTRIHKVEKKFKCHLCDYKARHKMSLIYHLKNHKNDSAKCDKFKCKRCNFKSDNKSAVLEHLKACNKSVKKHQCNKCDYATKKKSDLRRHMVARH